MLCEYRFTEKDDVRDILQRLKTDGFQENIVAFYKDTIYYNNDLESTLDWLNIGGVNE